MNIKYKQTIVLLIILIVEFIGFNETVKHICFNFIHPKLEPLFYLNINSVKGLCIIVLFVGNIYLYFSLKNKQNEPLFIVYLIKGFQVKGSDIIGIFNVVFILSSISWIGIELYKHTLEGVLNALIFSSFMVLYPMLIAKCFLPDNKNEKTTRPKVLISAISLVEPKKLASNITEMELTHPDKWKSQVIHNPDGSLKKDRDYIWGPWANLDPIRKSIIAHNCSFEQIILVLSLEAENKIKSFPEELKPVKIISDYIHKYYTIKKTSIRIISDGISGNDMIMNDLGLESVLQSLYKQDYKDRDVVFNITGATVAISGAMILKALKGDRKAEYARQDTGLIEEVPLSIFNVKELWYELLEKVG